LDFHFQFRRDFLDDRGKKFLAREKVFSKLILNFAVTFEK